MSITLPRRPGPSRGLDVGLVRASTARRSPWSWPSTRAGLAPGTGGLAWATAAVGTSGHSVAALLPALVAHLRVSPAAAGWAAAVFGLVCGFAAPAVAALTGRWERRRLLAACLLVAAAGNALAAAADDFGLLLAGRVVTALGAAVATSVAVGIAAARHGPDRRGRAVSVVLGGLALALLGGVPAAGALSTAAGPRVALGAVALLCLVAAGVVARTGSSIPAAEAAGVRARLAAARHPGTGAVLLGGLAAWASVGVVYPYVSTLLDLARGGLGLGVGLAAYGVGALAGTLGGGLAVDRAGPRAALGAATLGAAGVLVGLVPALDHSPAVGALTLAVWGACGWATTPALNARVLALAGDGQGGLQLALVGSVVYLGLGGGAALGGLVLDTARPPALAAVAVALAAAGAGLLLRTTRARERAGSE